MVEVKRKDNESFESLLRRFNRKIQQSGVLIRARRIRFFVPTKSRNLLREDAARRAVNLAEVSLHFDNSEGQLPIAFKEVVITRRLSRSGESDYLLNRAPCRLRDIHDLLRGTGLGGDSGVVIESKGIDALLSDRPDDRRELFEEAAGVGLYRDRRRSTERRLEETTADLARIDDLIGEVQSQVRSLARQRKRAERHAELMGRRFSVELTLAEREMRAWHEAGLHPGPVSVNLSARQFRQDGLVRAVSRIMEEAGLESRHLELELTESTVMHNVATGIATLHGLKSLGLSLSVDDFGTGYSSLSYLKDLPIDILKIDRSFVRDIGAGEGADEGVLAQAIVSLAHSLHLKVIAEGVETDAQLRFLKRHGCDEVQGFLYGEAVAPAEYAKLLDRKRKGKRA